MSKLRLYGFGDSLASFAMDINNKKIYTSLGNQIAMIAAKLGVVSLSANQIGSLNKIFTIVHSNYLKNNIWDNYQLKSNNYSVYINPSIKDYSIQKQQSWQQCASFPGIKFLILRSNKIKVEYSTYKQRSIRSQFQNFQARIYQHQIDHMEGQILINKASKIQIIDNKLKQKHEKIISQLWKQYKLSNQQNITQNFNKLKRQIIYRIIDHYYIKNRK